MQDEPSADTLLDAVMRFLKDEAAPALDGRLAFHARVAANAIDLARRSARLGPQADEDERARLAALLGEDGALATLNARLTASIADGRLGLTSPGVRDHLWRTTMDKLSIDQPAYATYRRALDRR